MVPALTGSGAPYWDAEARGLSQAFLEVRHVPILPGQPWRRSHSRAGRARRNASRLRNRTRGASGGWRRSRNDLLMQIQANVLGVPVVRPRQVETTVLGAAYLRVSPSASGTTATTCANRGRSIDDLSPCGAMTNGRRAMRAGKRRETGADPHLNPSHLRRQLDPKNRSALVE